MFCPQCGAENGLEQKYCRRCGLPLSAARISLQGGIDKALTKHKQGQILLCSGSVTLVIFALAALANFFLSPSPWNYGILINLLLGLGIGAPLMTAGVVQMHRAGRALHPKDEPAQLAGDQSEGARTLTSSVYSTDPLLSPVRTPSSITEETTLSLKAPKHGNG